MSLSEEDRKFLNDLREELNTQDKDSEAAPRFWAVGDYEWVAAYEGSEDRYSYYDSESESGYTSIEEAVVGCVDGEYTPDGSNESKEIIRKAAEYGVILYVEDDEWKVGEVNYRVNTDGFLQSEFEISFEPFPERRIHIIQRNTFFLTKEECKRHIESNRHNYNEPHTYAMTAYRSPQVSRLWEILEKTEW